jgi:hypothetical protein
MARKKHKIGDLVLCTPQEEDVRFVFGIIKSYDRQFYFVDWTDGNHDTEPYSWHEIQHWKEILQKHVKGR